MFSLVPKKKFPEVKVDKSYKEEVEALLLQIAPEDILRLTVRDIPNPESFHPDFNKFYFVPRSIGTGDTYVEAALSMFKVGATSFKKNEFRGVKTLGAWFY